MFGKICTLGLVLGTLNDPEVFSGLRYPLGRLPARNDCMLVGESIGTNGTSCSFTRGIAALERAILKGNTVPCPKTFPHYRSQQYRSRSTFGLRMLPIRKLVA